jgi:hypothetical protein
MIALLQPFCIRIETRNLVYIEHSMMLDGKCKVSPDSRTLF